MAWLLKTQPRSRLKPVNFHRFSYTTSVLGETSHLDMMPFQLKSSVQNPSKAVRCCFHIITNHVMLSVTSSELKNCFRGAVDIPTFIYLQCWWTRNPSPSPPVVKITFQGTNISHQCKRKLIFPTAFGWDMLGPWRVCTLCKLFQKKTLILQLSTATLHNISSTTQPSKSRSLVDFGTYAPTSPWSKQQLSRKSKGTGTQRFQKTVFSPPRNKASWKLRDS